MRKTKKSVQRQCEGSVGRLPCLVRCLCTLVCVLLVTSSLVELWMMLEGWFRGEVFQAIFKGYCQYYPELGGYPIDGWRVYVATLLLDFLGFIPYYAALILAAAIFFRFRKGIFWDRINIKLLKTISILIIFDACFPALEDTLQMLVFTSGGKVIFTMFYGVSAEGIRSLIIGISIYAFSLILASAKELEDENKLII